jgi:hypothetical protein
VADTSRGPESESTPEEIKTQAIDYVASGVKGALGLVPFAGPLLAEVAGVIIPRQRIDRLTDFAVKLEDRIANIEHGAVVAHLDDEEFTDLVEEAIRQAARSTSEDRRAYLASLVANSLTSDAITHAESKHLMRLLGELNDVEVLWLRLFVNPVTGADREFRELHQAVFESRATHLGSPQEEFDAQALQQSYKNHLEQLGLVKSSYRVKRDGLPEFDRNGRARVRSHETSTLGRLLLRTIGLHPDM